MTLTELAEPEIGARTAIGKPVFVGVPFRDEDWRLREEYSQRVRRMIGAMAPGNAHAYAIGDQAVPFEARVKDTGDIIGNCGKNDFGVYVSRQWYAHIVQYFE